MTDVETLQSPDATPSATPIFGALRHLCLSQFSLDPDYELLLSTLQIEQLQSLRLRECTKQLDFLEALTHSNRAINLRSFEIVHTAAQPHWDYTLGPLKNFLNSFTGLEELCWVSVTTHDST